MTQIRFSSGARTEQGRTMLVHIDDDTVVVGRGQSSTSGRWSLQCGSDGVVVLSSSGPDFNNSFGDGASVGTVVQTGDIQGLTIG